MKKKATELIDLIYKSPTNYQAVEVCKEILQKNKFKELKTRGRLEF